MYALMRVAKITIEACYQRFKKSTEPVISYILCSKFGLEESILNSLL